MKLLPVLRLLAKIVLALAGVGVAGAVALSPDAGCTRAVPVARLAAGQPAAAWVAARVARVVDGDTYDVVLNGARVRLRLLGVDAPELGQPFGAQAADSVRRVLAVGQLVAVRVQGVDLYGRTLGALRLPEAGRAVALDSLLVVRGWAWACDPAHKVAGRAAQQQAAQRAGRGLWRCGTRDAVPPGLWRSFNAENKRRYWVGCAW